MGARAAAGRAVPGSGKAHPGLSRMASVVSRRGTGRGGGRKPRAPAAERRRAPPAGRGSGRPGCGLLRGRPAWGDFGRRGVRVDQGCPNDPSQLRAAARRPGGAGRGPGQVCRGCCGDSAPGAWPPARGWGGIGPRRVRVPARRHPTRRGCDGARALAHRSGAALRFDPPRLRVTADFHLIRSSPAHSKQPWMMPQFWRVLPLARFGTRLPRVTAVCPEESRENRAQRPLHDPARPITESMTWNLQSTDLYFRELISIPPIKNPVGACCTK